MSVPQVGTPEYEAALQTVVGNVMQLATSTWMNFAIRDNGVIPSKLEVMKFQQAWVLGLRAYDIVQEQMDEYIKKLEYEEKQQEQEKTTDGGDTTQT